MPTGDLRYISSLTRVTYECGWDDFGDSHPGVTIHVRVADGYPASMRSTAAYLHIILE